jgi:hypothetical protein
MYAFTCRRVRETGDETSRETITHSEAPRWRLLASVPLLTWTARPALACWARCRYRVGRLIPVRVINSWTSVPSLGARHSANHSASSALAVSSGGTAGLAGSGRPGRRRLHDLRRFRARRSPHRSRAGICHHARRRSARRSRWPSHRTRPILTTQDSQACRRPLVQRPRSGDHLGTTRHAPGKS